jgi:hypothetical protein
MKGFKNTTRMKSGFSFPSKFGFSGSTGTTQSIASYTRRKPLRKAQGGAVSTGGRVNTGSALTARTEPTTDLNREGGGRSPLRPGFSKGGSAADKRMGYSKGGSAKARMGYSAGGSAKKRMGYSAGGKAADKRMGYAQGGGVTRAEAKRIAESTIGRHVRYPAPEGHAGLAAAMPRGKKK